MTIPNMSWCYGLLYIATQNVIWWLSVGTVTLLCAFVDVCIMKFKSNNNDVIYIRILRRNCLRRTKKCFQTLIPVRVGGEAGHETRVSYR